MEAGLVERNGISFKAIPAAGVHGVGLRVLPRNLWLLGRGVRASRRILDEFQPDVLFFTGGYVAVPMALAGWKVPTLLYVPDIEPGLALKTLARFADRITLTEEISKAYFNHPERLHVTGYPTRQGLERWNRTEAKQVLHLTDDTPVILIAGGSKGARSINQAVVDSLPRVLERAQVVHLTGELDWPSIQERTNHLSPEQAARYHGYPYLHEEMGAALASADLVISRAGASILGEYPLFGVPAILAPYPHAWRYQKINADFLAGKGGALVLEDHLLHEQLLPLVLDLLDHPERLAAMKAAMKSLSRPQAATEIGRDLFELSRRGR
jgi:UDP-N-acetylglucosamine:LPS N-acetylglucosamine transferase